MARLPNLRCQCGAFEFIDDDHVLRHGKARHVPIGKGECDPDPLLKTNCPGCGGKYGNPTAAFAAMSDPSVRWPNKDEQCSKCGGPITPGVEKPRVFRIGVTK